MTRAKDSLEALRAFHREATFTHLVLRAVALALSRNPRLLQTVCGYRRMTTASVDIGLSNGNLGTELPVVISRVDRMQLGALVGAVDDAVASTCAREARLGRIGWLTPFGFLRRWLLRRWYGAFPTRRRLAGTVEVCWDSDADVVVPIRFYTDAILSAGRVRDVVVVVDGQPAIRPMAWLTLCVDHVAFDGMRGAALINAVKEILEGNDLLEEALNAAASERVPS